MDYDIIVIGGGPAGLSAATRAAWLGMPEGGGEPARILILESGDRLGGLSQWQPLVINSPGVFFTRRELKALTAACRHFGVETAFEAVTGLEQLEGGGFEVISAGTRRSATAVVLATGCRRGHPGEWRLFHKRRVLWFHDNANLDHIVGQLDADPGITDLCVCGAEGVAATRARIGQPASLRITTVAEPPVEGELPPEIEIARLVRLGVSGLRRRLALGFARDGSETADLVIETDVLLVDFNAYEARAVSSRFPGFELPRHDGGFLDPDRTMANGVAGLFSAGDANGGPFCVAKAMSEGTIAGFSAYAYVHRLRYGQDPDLFPYYPYTM